MPIYSFRCEEHGKYECFLSMDECTKGKCPKCSKIGTRLFDPVHVYIDFTPGYDISLNRYVNTKKEREEILREKGLVRYKD